LQIGSTTLLANLFFACFWLGEELGRNDILGTFLVIRTLDLMLPTLVL
jgi:hypothetical protein